MNYLLKMMMGLSMNGNNREVFIYDYETEPEAYALKYKTIDTWLCYISNMTKTKTLLSLGINEMIEWVFKNGKRENYLYAHNAGRFDNHFNLPKLMEYCYQHDIELVDKPPQLGEIGLFILKTNKNVIMNMILSHRGKQIIFRDTAAIITGTSVKKLGETLGYKGDKGKGVIDYVSIRNYKKLSDVPLSDVLYIKKDVDIVIDFFNNSDIDLSKYKLTISAQTYSEYIKHFRKMLRARVIWERSQGIKHKNIKKSVAGMFNNIFPNLKPEMWYELKNYYSGGFTFVNPKFNNTIIKSNVKQYDVNSLYPFTMEDNAMPYGLPLSNNIVRKLPRKSLDTEFFTLWEIIPMTDLRIKKGFIPFIGKKNTFKGKGNEYKNVIKLGDIHSIKIPTPIKLLFEEYYEGNYVAIPRHVFQTKDLYFQEYFEHWKEKKKNGGVDKVVSKLMMNSLYGKFGQKIFFESYRYSLCPITGIYEQYLYEEKLELTEDEKKKKEGKYIPVAIATSSFAKAITIKAVQQNADKFIYCDTDSMHLLMDNKDTPKGIIIDNDKFGDWSNEWPVEDYGEVLEACYAGAKRYMVRFIKDSEPYNIVKIAGITNDEWKQTLSAEKFKYHIDNQTPIINGCKQKKSYVRIDSVNIPLPGVYLKEINKVLR